MKKINISKRKIVIFLIIVLLLIIAISVYIINSNSFKMNQYLKQNYTSYAEFKNSGYILVKKEDKFGIIDYNKNILLECIYENVRFIEYRDTYLILLKDSEKNILLNNKLEEIVNSKNDIIIYSDDGYVQTWLEDEFNLITIDNKESIAKGNINLENKKIEYILNNNYKLINETIEVKNEDDTVTEETSSILYNSNNEIIYQDAKISIFNKDYLLFISEQGNKLIDFSGKDVTIYYANHIQCKNGEIFLVDENDNNLVKLKITKTENGYDVVKEKVNS